MLRSLFSLALLCLSFFAFSQNLQQGIDQYRKGQLDAAKSSLKDIKSKSSEYGKAQYYLGRIAFDQNDFSDAIDYFKEAVDEEDENSDYYTWLGNSYGRLAQNSGKIRQGFLAPKIKKNYEKAVKFDDQNLDAYWGLVEYYTQAPAIMGGSWEKAAKSANSILAFDKKEGHRALATVYQRQEKVELAEEQYLKLVALDSAHAMTLGTFYQSHKKFNKAFDLFEGMYKQDNQNTGALYQIGRTSALSGLRTEAGIKALESYMTFEVKQGTPSYAAAKMRMAMIYEKTGNTTKARELYQASLDEDPTMQLARDGLKRLK